MTRPAVSVVMPFAGSRAEARRALASLHALHTVPGDELILADNGGAAPARDGDGVLIVRAGPERSPARARNAGAARATREWILFLDADCLPAPDLLDAYFRDPIADDVGAVAGEVAAVPDQPSLAARYAAARGFLGQAIHLAHPYLPRAVAANLLVRRTAFEQLHGFYEGLRAAEDTDFSWRLQRAGWRLEPRPEARVQHAYRTSLKALRRQWRGYAAGRAWLGRRYEGFAPEPALVRMMRRRRRRGLAGPSPAGPPPGGHASRRYLALDALLGLEELAGLALSNRPAAAGAGRGEARIVLVADRFPATGDPLVELARTLSAVRVEAAGRPESLDADVARQLAIDYREDDGAAARLLSTVRLLARHPLRCASDRRRRGLGDLPLSALAPAARRVSAERHARVLALGGEPVTRTAGRLAALAGRPLTKT